MGKSTNITHIALPTLMAVTHWLRLGGIIVFTTVATFASRGGIWRLRTCGTCLGPGTWPKCAVRVTQVCRCRWVVLVVVLGLCHILGSAKGGRALVGNSPPLAFLCAGGVWVVGA